MYKQNERAALSTWLTLLEDSVNYGIHRTKVTDRCDINRTEVIETDVT